MVRRSSSSGNKCLAVETTVEAGEIVQEQSEISESSFPTFGNDFVTDDERLIPTSGKNLLEENPDDAIAEPEIVDNNLVDDDLTADQMLRQARAASNRHNKKQHNAAEQEIPEYNATESASAASDYIEIARKEAALKVISATEQAQLARLQNGIEAGIAEIEDFNQGREIGRLLALAQSTNIHSTQLSQQLDQLRSHTDIQTAEVVQLALKGLGFDLSGNPQGGELKNPLQGILLAGLLPSRGINGGFKIFETE